MKPHVLFPKLLLEDDAYALSVERVASEISVVCLVIYLQGDCATLGEQILEREIAYETLRVVLDIVAIAELSVEEQTVVEESTTEQTFVLGIAEALVAWGYVGSEGESVARAKEVAHDAAHDIVELLGDCATEETLYGEGALADVSLGVGARAAGVDVAGGIEPADGEQIEDLLVHLFLGIDDRVYHLAGVGGERREIEVEGDGGLAWCACDVHKTVDWHVVGCEGVAYIEVGKGHTVDGVLRLHIEEGIVGVTAEGDGASLVEGEVATQEILDGHLIEAVVGNVVAEDVEPAFVEIVDTQVARAKEVDIVASGLVHKEVETGIGSGMNEEVEVEIGSLRGSKRK